jgi:hypothetical protein
MPEGGIMVTTRYTLWHCTGCGNAMTAAAPPDDSDIVPTEGDLSICLHCAEPHQLKAGQWTALSDDELIALSLEEKQEMSRMQEAVRAFNKWQKEQDR